MKCFGMRSRNFVVSATFILPCLVAAQAPEPAPLVTDRPDQTESPLTVPLNTFQIESGFIYAYANQSEDALTTETKSFDIGGTLLRYGMFSSFELRLSGGFLSQNNKSALEETNPKGLAGITLGGKYHVAEENGFVPETAIIASFILPVGQQELVSKKLIPGFLIVLGYTVSEMISISGNLGGLWGDESPFTYRYSASLGISLGSQLGSFVEFFGLNPTNTAMLNYLDAGLTMLIWPNFQLDASTGFSLNDNPSEWFISAGFSLRLPE